MGALDWQPAAAAAGGGGGEAGTPAPDPAASPGLLLSIPSAVLHEVVDGNQRILQTGALTISVVDAAQPGSAAPAAAAAPTAPATPPPLPAGKLYPDLYKGDSSSSSDSEGEGSTESSTGAAGGSSIVAAVGELAWELLPASHTLKVGEATYVFSTASPDSILGDARGGGGRYLTVTLAAGTEADLVGMLEAILEGTTIYRESEALLSNPDAAAGEAALAERAERAYRSSIARGVHSASRMLAGGLLATATYASQGISKGAAYLTPAEATTSPVAISPGLKKRFKQSARLAERAAQLVNSAVSGLAWAGAKVAGGVLWLVGADKPLQPGEEASTLREVGHAAVVGFTEVWDGMEEAGRTVLLSARDNTAGVVRQRYGEEASELSIHTMNAAGSSAEAAYAVRKIGVKTVAKAAAKRTAKGVIHKWASVGTPASGSAASTPGGSAEDLAGGAAAGASGRSSPVAVKGSKVL